MSRKFTVVAIFIAAGSTVAFGQCRDTWVSQAVRQVTGRPAQGSGDQGECDVKRYGGGHWSSYPDLVNKVRAAFTPTQAAQPAGQCRDAWVTQAVRQVTGRAPQGSGDQGECDTKRYGGGQWSSYPDLVNKVRAAFTPAPPAGQCRDPWVTRAVGEVLGRAPQGGGDAGECDPRRYGNGQWSSYEDLKLKVQRAYGRVPAPAPAPAPRPAPVAPSRPSLPPAVVLISQLGAKCVGVENGQPRAGSRLILWDCNGQSDQQYLFTADGQIHAFGNSGFCVTAYGQGNNGDSVQIQPCRGLSNQRWAMANGVIRGINNCCLDIRGGVYLGNRDAILYDCNGGNNQRYLWGKVAPRNLFAGHAALAPGQMTPPKPSLDAAGNVIAAGGGNVISAGGGNVIAAGGGNVIAAGGGNVIAIGGGNVIAIGGGNVIAAGGGN